MATRKKHLRSGSTPWDPSEEVYTVEHMFDSKLIPQHSNREIEALTVAEDGLAPRTHLSHDRGPASITQLSRPTQLRRSTIIAIPCPPPTHIVSRPIVASSVLRSLSNVPMIRAPVIPKG